MGPGPHVPHGDDPPERGAPVRIRVVISHHRRPPIGVRPRTEARERGAVTLVVAMSMTALMIVTSIVVDLGQTRAARHTLQNVVDVAALAAGYQLSGHGNAMVIADPQGACNSAFRSVKAN